MALLGGRSNASHPRRSGCSCAQRIRRRFANVTPPDRRPSDEREKCSIAVSHRMLGPIRLISSISTRNGHILLSPGGSAQSAAGTSRSDLHARPPPALTPRSHGYSRFGNPIESKRAASNQSLTQLSGRTQEIPKQPPPTELQSAPNTHFTPEDLTFDESFDVNPGGLKNYTIHFIHFIHLIHLIHLISHPTLQYHSQQHEAVSLHISLPHEVTNRSKGT
ncbi:unnamed protein product [Pleuronectes platessa]|uniref:Uncharacterized protein n=1 Tax=Pleuronectes platessa TaxID=8262 RepID=A0A9N7Z2X8_PLEPL|nr:unnamed protein product [Pleuronectes platessa]